MPADRSSPPILIVTRAARILVGLTLLVTASLGIAAAGAVDTPEVEAPPTIRGITATVISPDGDSTTGPLEDVVTLRESDRLIVRAELDRMGVPSLTTRQVMTVYFKRPRDTGWRPYNRYLHTDFHLEAHQRVNRNWCFWLFYDNEWGQTSGPQFCLDVQRIPRIRR